MTTLLSISSIVVNFNAYCEEINLNLYEKKIHSQNGEDGVIEIFFSVNKPESRFCVEFGAADGYWLSNTLNLRNKGWSCLLLDTGYENPTINLHKELVTAENINSTFAKHQVPTNLDFLSIDIDFNDFYVWNALNEIYKPALIAIEYNCSFGPVEDKTVIYNPTTVWDGTDYHGASVMSLYLLARAKGYSLIHVESGCTNCFFARDDIIEKLKQNGTTFKNINNVGALFKKTPSYHQHDPYNRPFVKGADFINKTL